LHGGSLVFKLERHIKAYAREPLHGAHHVITAVGWGQLIAACKPPSFHGAAQSRLVTPCELVQEKGSMASKKTAAVPKVSDKTRFLFENESAGDRIAH
jgi:hypothetical protein